MKACAASAQRRKRRQHHHRQRWQAAYQRRAACAPRWRIGENGVSGSVSGEINISVMKENQSRKWLAKWRRRRRKMQMAKRSVA